MLDGVASLEAVAAPLPTGLGVAPRADSLEGVADAGPLGVAEAAGVANLGVASILLFPGGGAAGFSLGLGIVALDEKLELT